MNCHLLLVGFNAYLRSAKQCVNVPTSKLYSPMFWIIILLEPPFISHHLINLWDMFLKYFYIECGVHVSKKTKQIGFTAYIKSTPCKNLCSIFRKRADWSFAFMPAFYGVTEELKGCLIRKQCFLSVIVKVLFGPFNTSFLMVWGKHWCCDWKTFFITNTFQMP